MIIEQLQRLLDATCENSVSARSLAYRLRARGLVALCRTVATFHEAIEPLCVWNPAQPPPDFGALAWLLEKRWRNVKTRRVTICWATPRAARRTPSPLGSGSRWRVGRTPGDSRCEPRRPSPGSATAGRRAARRHGGLTHFAARASQLEHDLGTASVLVRLHETRPELAADWVGEDILRRDFSPECPALKKIPDGAIVRRNEILRVVEFGGQYDASRLRRFHSHFGKKHQIGYDLW